MQFDGQRPSLKRLGSPSGDKGGPNDPVRGLAADQRREVLDEKEVAWSIAGLEQDWDSVLKAMCAAPGALTGCSQREPWGTRVQRVRCWMPHPPLSDALLDTTAPHSPATATAARTQWR